MKKLLSLAILCVFLSTPALAWQSSWRQPWGGGGTQLAILARNTDTVLVGGWGANPSVGGELYTGTQLLGIWWVGDLNGISAAAKYSIFSTAQVTEIWLRLRGVSGGYNLTLAIMAYRHGSSGRANMETTASVSVPQFHVSATSGTVDTQIILPSTLNTSIGNMIGIHQTVSVNKNFLLGNIGVDGDNKDESLWPDGTNTYNADFSHSVSAYPVRMFGAASLFGVDGDSLPAGVYATNDGSMRDFIAPLVPANTREMLKPYDPDTSFISQVAQFFGNATYSRLGQGSAQSSHVLARITSLAALKCKYFIIHVGINDIIAGVPYATFESNMDGIITAFVTAGTIPVISAMLPCGGYAGVNTTAQTAYAWNELLAAHIAAVYPTAIFVDSNDALGTLTGGASPYYTLKADYDSGDTLHLIKAGQIAWGKEVSRQLYYNFERPTTWARRW